MKIDMKPKAILRSCLPFTGFALVAMASSHAAVTQTNVQTAGNFWNAAAAWGGTAPFSTEDYITNPTATGAFSPTTIGLGADVAVTSRIRSNGTTFGGNSLTVVSGTEVLNGAIGTNTVNVTLNGGILRSTTNTTYAGSLNIASNGGYIGLGGSAGGGGNTFTVGSALTGSGILNLRSTDNAAWNPTILFNGDLSAFTGTFQIGGGGGLQGNSPPDFTTIGGVIVSFSGDHDISLASIVWGDVITTDYLNLGGDVTVGSFQFGSEFLDPGQYDVDFLNANFGNGSQFLGAGTLTIVPETSTILLGGLGSLLLLRRRKVM